VDTGHRHVYGVGGHFGALEFATMDQWKIDALIHVLFLSFFWLVLGCSKYPKRHSSLHDGFTFSACVVSSVGI
jgi:hypothetical protein